MNYAFSDFASTLEVTSNGNVKVVYDEEVIYQSLRHIFATVINERVRNPIGSTILRLLFENISLEVARDLKYEIREMIETWEPRVTVLNVTVVPDIDKNVYIIQINIDIPLLRKRSTFSTKLRSFANI